MIDDEQLIINIRNEKSKNKQKVVEEYEREV